MLFIASRISRNSELNEVKLGHCICYDRCCLLFESFCCHASSEFSQTNPFQFRNNQHIFRHTSLLPWATAHTEEEKNCKALQRKKVKKFTVLSSKEFKLPPQDVPQRQRE